MRAQARLRDAHAKRRPLTRRRQQRTCLVRGEPHAPLELPMRDDTLRIGLVAGDRGYCATQFATMAFHVRLAMTTEPIAFG
jgi:hypothetical protein